MRPSINFSSGKRKSFNFSGMNQSKINSKNQNQILFENNQTQSTFKGNYYFMKFEDFLDEFNSIYMLKILKDKEDQQDEESFRELQKKSYQEESQKLESYNMETGRVEKKKKKDWKCFVFESFWKGKTCGGPIINLDSIYNVKKNRFEDCKDIFL